MARIYFERRTYLDESRRLADWLERDPPPGRMASECLPPMDVVEVEGALQVRMDLPGVSPSSVKVALARGVLMISGIKQPGPCQGEAAFHLAERCFGRFARMVRLAGAFDAGRATAILRAGELRIVLPRIEERRGREIRIEVTGD